MVKSPLAALVLRWYAQNGRTLPWRRRSDPYAVWISEVMLQQTRVDAVSPYYERWMRRLPTIRSLAASSERDVLRLWEGLGYYARARNLRQAARLVMRRFDGRLPADLQALRLLPGVGPYTAGAIASIAFGLDEPALDGNIRRVLSRVFNVGLPADSAPGRNQLWHLAARNLPRGRAGAYNQALMDLGSTICLPKAPLCSMCPVVRLCQAHRLGVEQLRPVLRPRKQVPHFWLGAAVIARRGSVLLARRNSRGLLGGMWEFPNARLEAPKPARRRHAKALAVPLERAYGLKVRPNGALGVIRHAYTHFSVSVEAHSCKLISKTRSSRLRWVRLADLGHYPMGKVDREIARQLLV